MDAKKMIYGSRVLSARFFTSCLLSAADSFIELLCPLNFFANVLLAAFSDKKRYRVRRATPPRTTKMAAFTANEVIDILDEDMLASEVVTVGSDDEFEYR